MNGFVLEIEVMLDPLRKGHSYRYSLSGSGIIQLQIHPPICSNTKVT